MKKIESRLPNPITAFKNWRESRRYAAITKKVRAELKAEDEARERKWRIWEAGKPWEGPTDTGEDPRLN